MEPAYIIAPFVGGLGAVALRLPPLVGFLAAGFALNALGYESIPALETVSSLGVTLLLFTIGLKLNVRTLLRGEVWGAATLHMALSTGAFIGLLALLKLVGFALLRDAGLQSFAVLAFALSFSSTVFAVKVLEERSESRSLYGYRGRRADHAGRLRRDLPHRLGRGASQPLGARADPAAARRPAAAAAAAADGPRRDAGPLRGAAGARRRLRALRRGRHQGRPGSADHRHAAGAASGGGRHVQGAVQHEGTAPRRLLRLHRADGAADVGDRVGGADPGRPGAAEGHRLPGDLLRLPAAQPHRLHGRAQPHQLLRSG